MNSVLLEASDALSRNDATTLERLCEQIGSSGSSPGQVEQDLRSEMQTDEAKAAYHAALLAFRRQVLAARGNVVLRERLLAAGRPEASPWGR